MGSVGSTLTAIRPTRRHGLLLLVAGGLALLGPFAVSLARAEVGKVRIEGELEGLGVLRFDGSSPQQRPLARLDLEAAQRLTPSVSWTLSAVGRWGGPPEHVSGAGAFDWNSTYQNISPSLELGDAYVQVRGSSFDLRVGNQKFYWGVLDGVPPNDLLNPLEYEDPFLTDEKKRKIAVPALAADWYLPESWGDALPKESRFSLVWQPIATPWRYPLTTERWFAPAARSPQRVEVGSVDGTPCPCTVDVDQMVQNVDPPARRFDNGNVGVRMSGRVRDVVMNLMFFDGFDPAPAFNSPIRLTPGMPPAGGGPLPVTAQTFLQPAYVRFQSIGADASFALSDVSMRAETAYQFRRPYSFEVSQITDQILDDPDALRRLVGGEEVNFPAFVRRDSFTWGIGADTFFFDDFMPMLQLEQLVLFDNDERLLVRDVDTRITTNLRKPWLDDRIESEFLALWGIESGYVMLRTQAAYAWTDTVHLELGVLAIWGDRDTLVGQFRDNDEAYARVRYSF